MSLQDFRMLVVEYEQTATALSLIRTVAQVYASSTPPHELSSAVAIITRHLQTLHGRIAEEQ